MPKSNTIFNSNNDLIKLFFHATRDLQTSLILLSVRLKKSVCYFLLVTMMLFANAAFSAFIFPSNLTDKVGSSSLPNLDILTVKDQQGSDDVWEKYIEFTGASASGYSGVFQFNLPTDFNSTTSTVTLHANYRGQAVSSQRWEFQLLSVGTGQWVKVLDNTNVSDWIWGDISVVIDNINQFINSKNQISMRYISNNNIDNSQLDYLAFEINDSDSGKISSNTLAVTPWKPTPGMKWHIQYTGTVSTSLAVDIYNIDLFDTSTTTISTLRSKGKHVICYLSAGSYENWRPDANKFPASVLGRNLDGWAGERWLDVRRLDILIPIMKARMELAVKKGCHAVDPDNVDGYTNKTGFALTYNHQLAYNKALTTTAHNLGLSIGLKNNLDQIKDLVNYYDFAVNEECFQYAECSALKPFVNAGKPVFGIEYNLSTSSFCSQANSMNFDFQKKRLSLDAWVSACR